MVFVFTSVQEAIKIMEFLDYGGLKFYHKQLIESLSNSQSSVASRLTITGEDGTTVSIEIFGYYSTSTNTDTTALAEEDIEIIGEFDEV